MEIEQIWHNIAQKRRTWEPSNPEPNSEHSRYNRTLSRAISLRKLEIPVREFLQAGLDRSDTYKIGTRGIATLKRNQQDEEKHDIALERCFNAFASYHVVPDASQLLNEWIQLDEHPITKAAVLENGVFFVLLPILNLYGTPSMRENSQWISGDERLHVQSHRTAVNLLKAYPSPKLNKLRRATVDWLTNYMDEEIAPGQRDHFMRSSDRLMARGISALEETQFATKPAFFETSNEIFGKYA